jgi:uncharacterized membrane protein
MRITALVLIAASLLGDAYLLHLSSGPAGACGLACEAVLHSRWSQLGSVPVAWLAMGMHGLLGFALLRSANSAFWAKASAFAAMSVLAAALWFTGVQHFVLGEYCRWCLTVHGLGASGSLMALGLIRGRSEWSWQTPAWSVAAVSGLAIMQLSLPETATAKSQPTVVAQKDESVKVSADGSVHVFENEIALKEGDWPLIGTWSAEAKAIALTDYTCEHCRSLHRQLTRTQERFGEQLNVVLIPAVRDRHSEEIQKLMLCLWKAHPQVHDDLSRRLISGDLKAQVNEVHALAKTLLPHTQDLDRTLIEHAGWATEKLAAAKAIQDSATKAANSDHLPKLVLGKEILIGVGGDVDFYEQKLASLMSIRAENVAYLAPIPDADLGTPLAGTVQPWTLKLENPSKHRVLIDTIRMEASDGASSGGGKGLALEPGKSTSITLRLPIPVGEGDFERTVVIEGNTKPSKTRVLIKGTASKPCTLGQPQCADPNISTKLEVVEAGRHYRLHITLPADKPVSPLSALVQLPIDRKEGDAWPAALHIPVRVNRSTAAVAQLALPPPSPQEMTIQAASTAKR